MGLTVVELALGSGEGSDRAPGLVLRLVQRSWQPFLADAEGGGGGRSSSPDPGGTGAARTGHSHDPGLLAAGARALGAQLRNLARAAAAGVAAGRMYHAGRSESFLRQRYLTEFNRRFQVAAAERGSAFVPCPTRDLERVFFVAVRAHGEPR
jgi:hypothetical protein